MTVPIHGPLSVNSPTLVNHGDGASKGDACKRTETIVSHNKRRSETLAESEDGTIDDDAISEHNDNKSDHDTPDSSRHDTETKHVDTKEEVGEDVIDEDTANVHKVVTDVVKVKAEITSVVMSESEPKNVAIDHSAEKSHEEIHEEECDVDIDAIDEATFEIEEITGKVSAVYTVESTKNEEDPNTDDAAIEDGKASGNEA